MSSLLALQTKDTIVFASDTALSAEINGINYRVDNNENKLFEYDNFIMFASGKKYLRDLFIELLPLSPTIRDIELILKNHILKYSEEFSLEIVIAMKDLAKLIFFSSTNSFEYSESTPNNYTNLYTAGYLTNEIASEFELNYKNRPLLQSLKNTYKKLSCSEIGGNLDVFVLEKDNVRKIQYQIDTMKTYSDEELLMKLNLVHAERLVGRIILSNKLWVEDELGVVEIQSGIAKFYDENGKVRVYVGKYPSFENPNVLKTGIRVDDGSFELRTSSETNRGILLDGNSISAFNSNSVRTFNVDASTGKVSIIGNLDIRSSSSSNAGFVLDSDGLKGYKSNGTVGVEITNTGNITYAGLLNGATGSVTNLTGSMDNMTGTFAGTLSPNTVNAIEINAEQITAGQITSNQIQAGAIDATSISVDKLSAISSDLGDITAGTITIDTDMKVGKTLWIGHNWLESDVKSIRFGGTQGGSGISFQYDTMSISAVGGIKFEDDTKFYGTVDFSEANVIGI